MLLIFLDKTNCFKDMQLLNVYRCIAVILSGIFILFSDVQPEKAPYAIPRSAILSGTRGLKLWIRSNLSSTAFSTVKAVP